MLPLRLVTCHEVPVADVYCTLQPASEIAAAPELKISMKSFLYVAPELPPPPEIWLMTTPVELARGKMVVKANRRATTASDSARFMRASIAQVFDVSVTFFFSCVPRSTDRSTCLQVSVRLPASSRRM